ncbi:HNH endonuclease domain-containing protein [Pontibacter korlensis]|uniref:HNH nuclease domain-containing protein n=1 Tax=Pontibacter korlensis TaxID=400092 RepID=A0A0E3UZ12_9BACT|nr:HNH endonuclease domain-containing protein [Pontibacter korlensis]AKD04931.1 hypothetical protein PKOR_19825 [Pontibacter korlensis]
MHDRFEDIDYWKAIILYGLNAATYKIALGKTLLELTKHNNESLEWSTLAKAYLDNYINRLSANPLPQQSNPSRRTVMERITTQLRLGTITYEEALGMVEREAFNDVIPRFHTIGVNKLMGAEKFYHFDHGKKLYLHDSLFRIHESSSGELYKELDARWSLLEGAFQMGHDNWDLANDIREIYIKKGTERTNITGNIPFLNGYQGNVCFYCGEQMAPSDIHVDHVLPRQVVMHDEIWNLVLSHSLCNLHKEDFLVGKHYLEKLIDRNENIMGSNHPWKHKISASLGATKVARAKSTYYHYENVRQVLGNRYWENSPTYNRATDPFYKKLITQLNNKP